MRENYVGVNDILILNPMTGEPYKSNPLINSLGQGVTLKSDLANQAIIKNDNDLPTADTSRLLKEIVEKDAIINELRTEIRLMREILDIDIENI